MLLTARISLRGRATELCIYAVIAVGLFALIGASAYVTRESQGPVYAQVLPATAAADRRRSACARGARRYGPAIGVVIVFLSLARDIFSQLQVIARFYG